MNVWQANMMKKARLAEKDSHLLQAIWFGKSLPRDNSLSVVSCEIADSGRHYIATTDSGESKNLQRVTTILDSVARPDLAYWYATKGLEAERIRKNSAAVGTEVHYAIAAWWRGEDTVLWDYPESEAAFSGWLEWADQHAKNYELLASEIVLWNWNLEYAGTADLVLRQKSTGEIVLIDVKTSMTLRDSYRLQLAMYANCMALWGGAPQRATILHLDKKNRGKWSESHVWKSEADSTCYRSAALAYASGYAQFRAAKSRRKKSR